MNGPKKKKNRLTNFVSPRLSVNIISRAPALRTHDDQPLHALSTQWLFPDSSEGERKFLVRTDFGTRGGTRNDRGKRGHDDDDTIPGSKSLSRAGDGRSVGRRDKLFLLVELTCTVQTSKDGIDGDDEEEDYGRLGGLKKKGGSGPVNGPLKNFRAGGAGRRKGKGRRHSVGDGDDSNSSSDDDEEGTSSGGQSEVKSRHSHRVRQM